VPAAAASAEALPSLSELRARFAALRGDAAAAAPPTAPGQ
jgi:hypothetical protein